MGAFEVAAVVALSPTLVPAGSSWSLALLGGLLGLLGIVGLAEQRVDRLGHLETETVSLEIQRDETGAYTLSKDSFDRLDARIIDYPMLEP